MKLPIGFFCVLFGISVGLIMALHDTYEKLQLANAKLHDTCVTLEQVRAGFREYCDAHPTQPKPTAENTNISPASVWSNAPPLYSIQSAKEAAEINHRNWFEAGAAISLFTSGCPDFFARRDYSNVTNFTARVWELYKRMETNAP